MALKLSIVVPVYNEAESIKEFHSRVSNTLSELNGTLSQIIYVVDPCSDETIDILRKIITNNISYKTIALTMSSRFGHQMALLAGIEYCQEADMIIMMDADLQHPPELIPKLIAEYKKGYDVVYTKRIDTEKINFFRKFFGTTFYRALKLISDVEISENAADFRLISKKVSHVLSSRFPERNMFMRGLFSWIGFKQSCVEFLAKERFSGATKYSLSRMYRLGMDGILSTSTRPLHLGIFIGLIFSFFGFVFVLFLIGQFFLGAKTPSGWTTLAVLLLFFSGLQLILLGVIGSYIGGIYDEVKRRPRYIIDEIIGG
jgi:dolichol-phosphate mannosyltransferase